MNSALKKEMALLTGLYALKGFRSKPAWVTGLWTAGAVGLWWAAQRENFSFKNKHVYVTGGSRGLGLSIAWNLLDRGARVTLVARDEAELARARQILRATFPEAVVHVSVCDITERDQLQFSINDAIQKMGGIDLIVNNAGAIMVGPFTSMNRAEFEAQMKLHVYAVVDSTQILIKHFESRGGGRILNICSVGGKVAVPHMLPYDASKFALAGLSQGLTAELAARNIRVTTAYPTVMRTGSPIQAVFKGNAEKEFQWFHTIDNLPGLSMSADAAAKQVLDAVSEGRTEVVMSLAAKARLFAGVFFPELMNGLMSVAARLLPSGDGDTVKTGAQARALVDKNPALEVTRQRGHDAELRYNQEPKHDANFNAGLLH